MSFKLGFGGRRQKSSMNPAAQIGGLHDFSHKNQEYKIKKSIRSSSLKINLFRNHLVLVIAFDVPTSRLSISVLRMGRASFCEPVTTRMPHSRSARRASKFPLMAASRRPLPL